MGGVASGGSGGAGTSIFHTPDGVNATAQVIDTGSVVVYAVKIDGTLNPGEDPVVRFYNTATPTVGTTQALMVLRGKAGASRTYTFKRGLTAFGTAFSVAALSSEGAGAGTANPTGTVKVTARFT